MLSALMALVANGRLPFRSDNCGVLLVPWQAVVPAEIT
jgi:hypothetical protein